MVSPTLEPDQSPDRWDSHVSVYEEVFEPFSNAFAKAACDAIGLAPGMRVLDVGAGSGGAALTIAAQDCRVTAIDASARMVARISDRAAQRRLAIDACVMDGQALTLATGGFDAAISVFGVILFPDAVRGLSEMRRVVRPGGHVAVVTWTEPQHYELSAALRAAIQKVRPVGLAPALPAQLRFRERADFIGLFHAAGFAAPHIEIRRDVLTVPSARWLGERLRFAPGMAAQLDQLGPDADSVVAQFIKDIEARWGTAPAQFGGSAFVGSARVI